MSELEKRFLEQREKCEGLSDIVILWYAAKSMKYPRPLVSKVFNKCVSKEEYEQEDKKELIDYIYNYSNE